MSETMTKRAAMHDRIERHGRTLLRLFPDAIETDPVKLCKKLRRIEISANANACSYSNGHMDLDEWERTATRHLQTACRILGVDPEGDIPIFINGDPRGYTLKIADDWTRKNAPDLHRDWGGYGILAPDMTND